MTVKCIKGFEIEKVLTDIEVQEDEISKYKRKDIGNGAMLHVADNGQASIEFPGHEVIEFLFDNEVARMFARIDEYTAEEFIAILAESTGIF